VDRVNLDGQTAAASLPSATLLSLGHRRKNPRHPNRVVATCYAVGLASYDPIPTLTGVADQSTSLTNPNSVQVYVNGSTQMLNSTPISIGNVARFQGLLFNDGGTLRMVCMQVSDGVAE
jgi:hypothetical protein